VSHVHDQPRPHEHGVEGRQDPAESRDLNRLATSATNLVECGRHNGLPSDDGKARMCPIDDGAANNRLGDNAVPTLALRCNDKRVRLHAGVGGQSVRG
jgi:hypothetical protein